MVQSRMVTIRTGTILYINSYVLENGESYWLLRTIRHELRHCYQHAATYGMHFYDFQSSYEEPYTALLSWNINHWSYIDASKDYNMYLDQAIEKDARLFAEPYK